MGLSPADLDALQAQLHQRLLESGEWDRIRLMLATKLNDCGWNDDLQSKSKEHARGMAQLSFAKLFEEMLPQSSTNLPLAVRREITALIKTFLDKQFE